MNRTTTPARPHTRAILSLSALALLITGAVLYAGPLNPPAGPVTSTYKTLTEVEPRTAINATNTPGDADSLFKITQPGSYYLTGNITGVFGKHGIEITASGVTLDLNGFQLLGIVIGGFDGVSVTVDGLTNIAVVNGSVRSWSDEGVDLGTFAANNCRVEGVHASGNVGNGISSGFGSTVTNCRASSNTGLGFSISSGGTVTNCSASNNTRTGISTGAGCTVSNCSAYDNTGNGINTASGCTVSNCSAYSNTGDGISTFIGGTVSNCSAYTNTGNGISASNGSTVADCTVTFNILDGIGCSSSCVIRSNTCLSNGNGGDGAGIHAAAGNNRIEGNSCTLADRGIDVDSAGNIIIRNTCAGNTIDWTIVANNVFGPILDRRAPASAAVSGFTAASTLGSTDSNANFSY